MLCLLSICTILFCIICPCDSDSVTLSLSGTSCTNGLLELTSKLDFDKSAVSNMGLKYKTKNSKDFQTLCHFFFNVTETTGENSAPCILNFSTFNNITISLKAFEILCGATLRSVVVKHNNVVINSNDVMLPELHKESDTSCASTWTWNIVLVVCFALHGLLLSSLL